MPVQAAAPAEQYEQGAGDAQPMMNGEKEPEAAAEGRESVWRELTVFYAPSRRSFTLSRKNRECSVSSVLSRIDLVDV